MSALKDGRYEIMLDKPRHLLFDLNVIDELNDRYGGYDRLGDILNKEKNPKYIKDLKWILSLLLNEGADEGEPMLTEQQVGKLINPANLPAMTGSIFKAFSVGTTGQQQPAEPDPEDIDENPMTAAPGTI